MKFQSLTNKFIPSDSADGNAVLVLVHGRTGNLRSLEWFAKRATVPKLSYLIVQAPYVDQRPDQKDLGYSWYLQSREGIDQGREKLLGVIAELEAAGYSPRDIYFLGFSQGAAMSLDIALRSPQVFGGFICVSGLCVQADTYPAALSAVAKKQRILITHGTRDEIISLEYAQKTFEPLESASIPFELKVYDKPHSFKMNEEIPEIESRLRDWMGL